MKIHKIIAADILVPSALTTVLVLFRHSLSAKAALTLAALTLPWLMSLGAVVSARRKNREDIDSVVAGSAFGIAYFITALLVSLVFGLLFRVSTAVYITLHSLLAVAAALLLSGLLRGKNPAARRTAGVPARETVHRLAAAVAEKAEAHPGIPAEVLRKLSQISLLCSQLTDAQSGSMQAAARDLLIRFNDLLNEESPDAAELTSTAERLIDLLSQPAQ